MKMGVPKNGNHTNDRGLKNETCKPNGYQGRENGYADRGRH